MFSGGAPDSIMMFSGRALGSIVFSREKRQVQLCSFEERQVTLCSVDRSARFHALCSVERNARFNCVHLRSARFYCAQ